MTTAYRKQVPAKPEPMLSFVAAVKAAGTEGRWIFQINHVPDAVRAGSYEHTHDFLDFVAMKYMELGTEPRVDFSDDDLNAYEPIIRSYWAKPGPERWWDWEAYRDGYEPGQPIGYGPTEARAIENLIEQEGE